MEVVSAVPMPEDRDQNITKLTIPFNEDESDPGSLVGSEEAINGHINDACFRGEQSSPLDGNCSEEHRVGVVTLAVLVFYSVSGGPFGCEASVRYGGVLFALLGFAILPFVWSIPEALVTAELGSAYPEASGGVAWVEEAFGAGTGLFAGYLTWIAGVTDNGIYPALFLEYITSMIGKDEVDEDLHHGGFTRFLLVVSIAVALSFINYTGLQIVGKMSLIVCFISMSPFFLLAVFSLPKMSPNRWIQTPKEGAIPQDEIDLQTSGWLPFPNYGGVVWRPFLNNLFWNLNSFDSAANFAGDVHDPGRIFPRAMLLSVVLVILCYFLPLLAATGATSSSQQEWTEGHLAAIASEVVGPWLGVWTVFASGVSNLALYEAEMSADSLQLLGMAQRGMAPKIFCRRSRYGTATNGILLGTLIVIVMSTADFTALVEMLNFSYSVSLLLEFSAFVKLRISHSHVPRPYRVPVNTFGSICLIIPPCCLTILVMMLASWMTYIYFAVVLLLGFCVFVAERRFNCTEETQAEVPKKRAYNIIGEEVKSHEVNQF